MHYQEKIDKIFGGGSLWQHRTLRTLFDPYSSEYDDTTMDRKVEILKVILENGISLKELIRKYKKFYSEENKRNVVDSVEDGLVILLSNSLIR